MRGGKQGSHKGEAARQKSGVSIHFGGFFCACFPTPSSALSWAKAPTPWEAAGASWGQGSGGGDQDRGAAAPAPCSPCSFTPCPCSPFSPPAPAPCPLPPSAFGEALTAGPPRLHFLPAPASKETKSPKPGLRFLILNGTQANNRSCSAPFMACRSQLGGPGAVLPPPAAARAALGSVAGRSVGFWGAGGGLGWHQPLSLLPPSWLLGALVPAALAPSKGHELGATTEPHCSPQAGAGGGQNPQPHSTPDPLLHGTGRVWGRGAAPWHGGGCAALGCLL